MGLFRDIAHLFGFHDGPNKPSQQDLEDAQVVDEFLREGGEGEPFFEEREEMDTVPSSHPGYEGEDTDKHDASFLRRLLGW